MRLKTLFKYIFLLSIGLSILYFLFKNQYNPNFFTDLQHANWNWAIFSAFLVLVSHLFRALRWRLMITPLQGVKPKISNTFNALMLGYLANLVVPRAGEVARCVMLAKKENLNSISLLGTVIAERIVDLLMLVFLILVGFIFNVDLFISFIQQLNLLAFIQNINLFIISGIVVCIFILFALLFYLKKSSNILLKVKYLGNLLKDGVLAIKEIKAPFLFFTYTLIIWILYILSTLVCFNVLAETSFLGLSASILTVIAGSLGMIAPIQGGIGAYHFMVTEVLALLNINKSIGLEFATIIHASQTLVVIIFGLLALILGFNLNKNTDEK